jgi:sulfur-oxidizing protein SoxY
VLKFTRRQALTAGGVALIGIAAAPAASARSTAQQIINEYLAGAKPQTRAIDLDVPANADNPNAVHATIKVDSPMTPESYCKEIVLIAEGNPWPLASRFSFGPGAAIPHVSTRIRLAESQRITALARMSDGSVLIASKDVIVAVSGCGG